MIRRALVALACAQLCACAQGNVCERRLQFEEEDCFPELEQPHTVDDDECRDTEKVRSQCAMSNEDAYCDWFLWQNRGSARREGYTVPDYLGPGNAFVECLNEAGLEQ